MPFKSKKQHRYFRYMESKGEIPKGTSDKWMDKTKNYNKLPEKKASFRKKLMDKISSISVSAPLKPIETQADRLSVIGSEKRKGMSPVEYRYFRKNRY